MSEPSPDTPSTLSSLLKRRRLLAMASTAIGLVGCAVTPSSNSAPQLATAAERQAIDERVKTYASDIELALDKVDRDRLRAAAEKKNAAVAPSQAPVILASAGAEAEHGSASHAPAAHAPVSPAPAPASHGPTPAPAATGGHGTPAPAAAVPASATPTTHAPEPIKATESAAPVARSTPSPEKTPAVVKAAESAVPDVAAAPLSTDTGNIRSAVITPVDTPKATAPAAMGAMNAIASAAPHGPAIPAGAVEIPEPTVEDAMAVLKKNIETHPTLSTSLALALLDHSAANDAVKGLSDSDQKVFTDLLGALETMKTAAPGSTVADRAAPLLNAAKKWQADADLSLPRLVLATRVDSFGVFTPVDAVFEQGKRRTVIIYCEVANFASKKGDDGWYTTHLTQQETLMTHDNLLVWRPNAEDVEDRSLNQRRDFYLVKKLTIPENLAAGTYSLVMNVTDKISGKKNIVTLPIEIK